MFYYEGLFSGQQALSDQAAMAPTPAPLRLCLPTHKGFTVIDPADILYCEAHRSYTLFRLNNNKSIMVSRPLFDYEKMLSHIYFHRIHKSFLVNLLQIREYYRGEGGSVLMSNGVELEVSRRKKESFISRMKQHFMYLHLQDQKEEVVLVQ